MAIGPAPRLAAAITAAAMAPVVWLPHSCSALPPSRVGHLSDAAVAGIRGTNGSSSNEAAVADPSLATAAAEGRSRHAGTGGLRAATISADGIMHLEAAPTLSRSQAGPRVSRAAGRAPPANRSDGARTAPGKESAAHLPAQLSEAPDSLGHASRTFGGAVDRASQGGGPALATAARQRDHWIVRHDTVDRAMQSTARDNATAAHAVALGALVGEELEVLGEELEYELNMRYVEDSPRNKLVLAAVEALGLGCCGFDRCFMGQPILGFVKGATLGGLMLWALIDYLLILANCFGFSRQIDAFGIAGSFEEGTVGPAFILFATVLALKVTLTASRLRELKPPRRPGLVPWSTL